MAKDERMMICLERVAEIEDKFQTFEVRHVPREENDQADSLSKLASSVVMNAGTTITILTADKKPVLTFMGAIDAEDDWRTKVQKALAGEDPPRDVERVRAFMLNFS